MPRSKILVLATLALVLASALARGQESIEAILAEEYSALESIEAQIQAQEYDYPILWLEKQIGAVERSSHRYSPELIRPLTLLGDAKVGSGDYNGALDHYQRAVHLSRVNDGLNSSAQIEIVYREANAYKALGNLSDANDREEYAYHVLTRVHGPHDEELLPGVYHLAEWYGATQDIFSARALYEHAVSILSANGKQGSAIAIPAYQGIARTYRLERFPPFYVSKGDSGPISVNDFPAGERALQQIIQIHRDDADLNPVVLAEAMLDLADWYLLFDKTRRAFPLYDDVYAMLSEAEGFAVADFFAEPKLLYFPAPQDPRVPPLGMRGERKEGFVEVAYKISKTGYARSLKTIGAEPQGLMDFRVRKSLRLSRYRPALVEGRSMAKFNQTYRHQFAYFPKLETAETMEATKGE
ncbi:MAG: hypothetical protein O7E57_02375 [Gammaproteobacteria bacterium]|nr:hypothetical protein [Gammaproteobacteria bacterium]